MILQHFSSEIVAKSFFNDQTNMSSTKIWTDQNLDFVLGKLMEKYRMWSSSDSYFDEASTVAAESRPDMNSSRVVIHSVGEDEHNNVIGKPQAEEAAAV